MPPAVGIVADRIFYSGLLVAILGISTILAVFAVPISHPIRMKSYERKEMNLHDVEDLYFEHSNYFVSIYIQRGRNIYSYIYANSSFNFFILSLEEWTNAVSEGREYSDLFAKYLNVSEANAYFNAPENGYYIFEIQKISGEGKLMIHLFQVKEVWTELVDKISGYDYDYTIIVWGGIIAAVGTSIALYAILPRQPPQGLLR